MKQIVAWSEYCKSLTPAVLQACSLASAADGPGGLVKALGQALPDWQFRHVFCRGGWYRLGGIVASDGGRIADDLEAWAEASLEERNGDMAWLAEEFGDKMWYATRLVGRTHYLVAQAGELPGDFLQLEVEALQEVFGHRLFAEGKLPATMEELVDPREAPAVMRPVDMQRYAFRRLAHVGSVLARMPANHPDTLALARMLEDWGRSSAGSSSVFCHHWVIVLREHLDCYRQSRISAQPIPTLEGALPEFFGGADTHGLGLRNVLAAFDRALGYPMAWFFHLVAGRSVPHWVAQNVVEDALAGFAYLPQKDVAVARDWLHRQYGV